MTASDDNGASSSSSTSFSPIAHIPTLSSTAAQAALTASLAHAESINCPVNISVYDSTAHLLAFHRMQGAKLTSIDIAHNKALTAAGHRNPTDWYGSRVDPGGALWGVQNSNGGRFCTIAGGEPVVVEGACLAGIGVSGGLPSQDKEIALAGVNKILELISAAKSPSRSRY